jgi:hypothetical protein
MAKQKGAVKLSGTIGDISFYEANDQFLAREKTGPTRREVLTKDNFDRTRENALEFGRCSKAGKLLRSALGLTSGTHPDPTVTNRLTERLVRVLHSDTRSPRGKRRIQLGELSILERFEFIESARLADRFFARYAADSNREEGTCILTFPPFTPTACLHVPPHATRVKLIATALALDFEHYTAKKAVSASEPLRLDSQLTAPLTLTCTFDGPTALPLLLVLGLQFMEEHEGFCYPMREKEFNALSIVLADDGKQ